MLHERMWTLCATAVCGCVALAMAATAIASPYFVSYSGTISGSEFPEIISGQTYTVTVVVDNGNATTASQTWSGSALTCVIWRMNTAGNVFFAQDLAATNASLFLAGSLTTNAAGVLTGNFSEIDQITVAPVGTYASGGIALVPDINWYMNSFNDVFQDQVQLINTRSFADASGGVQMAVPNWTNPQPYTGTCLAGTGGGSGPGGGGGGGGGTPAAPVPTLSDWMQIVLASLLGISALFVLRRRRS